MINVLSCFDGISCGMLALDRAGIDVNKYYASEVDKYAEAISAYQYPDIIRLGDVRGVTANRLDLSDGKDWLLIGGSPCQSFSFAGRQLNFEDPRGQLFFEFVRIKEELNPKWFLLENTPMKKESQDVISQYLGVEPVVINSNLVSAQNRKRNYWTNIPINEIQDKGILLKDVIEFGESPSCVAVRGRDTGEGKRDQMVEPREDGKTNTITTVAKDNLVFNPVIVSNIYGGYNEDGVRAHDGKSPAIRTSAGGGHIPKTFKSYALSEEAIAYMSRERNGKPRWEYHTNPLEGKAACLTANMCKGVPYRVIKELLRSLTPIECERLQTLSDNYTKYGNFGGVVKQVSDTRRFSAIGNGWTVNVLTEIFRGIK